MNIVLIGIQGSGKGTLVENLKQKLKFSLISVGELLRGEVKKNTKLGKHIKQVQAAGNLVEIETVMAVIQKKLAQNENSNIVFDGFPRNSLQAEEFDKLLKLDLVIYLNLDKQTAITRLLNRLTCTNCGSVFNKTKVKNDLCPNCGGKLETRFDDTLEGINKRIEQFYIETYPLVKRYKKQKILAEVDASKTPNQILKDVMRAINEHNN